MIEWDPTKNKKNKAKHKISFELASLVFEDKLRQTRPNGVVGNEQRFETIGMVHGELLVLVVHTWLDMDGTEYIRIISARKAIKHERKSYEQAN